MFLDSVIYLKNPPNMSVTSIGTGANRWEVMSPSLFPRQTFKEAAQLMHERKFALPVLDAQGQVIGIPDPW